MWADEKLANPERAAIDEAMMQAKRAGRPLDYVHDYCMPRYALTLGLDTREYECSYQKRACALRRAGS